MNKTTHKNRAAEQEHDQVNNRQPQNAPYQLLRNIMIFFHPVNDTREVNKQIQLMNSCVREGQRGMAYTWRKNENRGKDLSKQNTTHTAVPGTCQVNNTEEKPQCAQNTK